MKSGRKKISSSESFSKSETVSGKKCCSRSYPGLFFGILFIAFGVLILLKTTGVLDFTFFQAFSDYWPIGLILVGVALIFKQRGIAFMILILTLVIGGATLFEGNGVGELREITQVVPLKAGVESADVSLGYGAGDLSISIGDGEYILQNNVKTTDINDPELKFDIDGKNADVKLERQSGGISFVNGVKSNWDVLLFPEINYNLELDYGAVDLDMDLTGLKVDEISIESGATGNKIIFDEYPTKVSIDTGASSLNFKFPEKYGVKITVDGGAISTDLDGFTKNGKSYVNEFYDKDSENIEIDISAGATSIEGSYSK